jgi:hypothetical protein
LEGSTMRNGVSCSGSSATARPISIRLRTSTVPSPLTLGRLGRDTGQVIVSASAPGCQVVVVVLPPGASASRCGRAPD